MTGNGSTSSAGASEALSVDVGGLQVADPERVIADACALIDRLRKDNAALRSALSALIHEIDQVYDVDDGRANIPGSIMELVRKGQAAISRSNTEDGAALPNPPSTEGGA